MWGQWQNFSSNIYLLVVWVGSDSVSPSNQIKNPVSVSCFLFSETCCRVICSRREAQHAGHQEKRVGPGRACINKKHLYPSLLFLNRGPFSCFIIEALLIHHISYQMRDWKCTTGNRTFAVCQRHTAKAGSRTAKLLPCVTHGKVPTAYVGRQRSSLP